MENRFNNLTSKEWLPFQKSWFKFEDWSKLYNENIRFFTKKEKDTEVVYYSGPDSSLFGKIVNENSLNALTDIVRANCVIQYALIDLMDRITTESSIKEYEKVKNEVLIEVRKIYSLLSERRFITLIVPNIERVGCYFPFAWDIAKEISTIYSLKDEKIGCSRKPD